MEKSKVKTGLNLVAVVSPPVLFLVTAIDEKVQKTLGIGGAIKAGQAYIVLGLGTSAQGSIYVLTKNDIGEFVWIPDHLCSVQIHQQPQPGQKLVLPNMRMAS